MPVPDTTILQWLADFRTLDTNSPSQNDWEGGVVRDLDDEFRNIKSVVRSWSVPVDNKVWQVVEKPNTIRFVQHATLGFVIKVEFIDITARLEPLQILKADYTPVYNHVYAAPTDLYFVVSYFIMEGSHTLIQVQPLPIQFVTTWYNLTGNVLAAGFSLADFGFTGPFQAYVAGSPPVTGKQGLVIFDSAGVMSNGICDQIDDDSFSTYFTSAALFGQQKITLPSQVKQTWAINCYPNITTTGPVIGNEFVNQIYLGIKPSLFPKSYQSGAAVITGTGIPGPYPLSNFPREEVDATYQISLQVKATTIPVPTARQLSWRALAKTTTNFSLTAQDVIPAGQTVTFDWVIHR